MTSMSYSIWVIQQPFWDCQYQPREQDDVWLRHLPQTQGQNYGTNQQLSREKYTNVDHPGEVKVFLYTDKQQHQGGHQDKNKKVE